MRILTAATRLDGIGGFERSQLEICRQLAARGHHIDLLYTEDGDLSPAWAEVAERRRAVHGYAFHRRSPRRSAGAVAGVIAAVRRLAPDVVYVHHHRHTPSVALAGRPVACHVHLPPPPRRAVQERLGLARVRGFLAVSAFTARQWSERLGLPVDRFAVVHSGVDVERFRPLDTAQRAAVRARYGLPSEPFLIAYAGRIDPERGVDVALSAIAGLDAAAFHLAVAGEPNPGSFGGDGAAARAYGRDLRARFRHAPATWIGRVTDTAPLLAAADLVVRPSLFPESLPLIVLEALGSGTPVVASDVGGIPEVLSGPLAANLVAPGDARALAARIRALRSWRDDDPELGVLGRRHVKEAFTLERIGERVEAALADVAGDSG